MTLPTLDTFLFWLAIFSIVGYIYACLDLGIGNRKLKHLVTIPPLAADDPALPSLSIVIPARNEAREIREALTSVLNLDYPDFEVIVLDDRSEDATGSILDEMATEHPRLKVVHITDLPHGWLGKNHAMYQGAMAASGEWILFTDADVMFDPTTLRRAIRFARERGRDHIAGLPEIVPQSPALTAFICAFTIFFSFFSRPWDAVNPRRKSFIGIGAFNLIRADVYRKIGTHQAIAMRPDDDIKLGKLVKKNGFRQEAFVGAGLISVAWYPNLGALVEGLMKNAFTGTDYRVSVIIFGVLLNLTLHIWPVMALFVTYGKIWLLNFVVVMMLMFMCWDHARLYKMPRWIGFAFPWASLMMTYIIVRATIKNLSEGGITWRGTFYPLAELKANDV